MCQRCGLTFKTRANLYNHNAVHSDEKRYSCTYCDAKFSHKTSLVLHTRWHTGEKPFRCSFCDKSFSQVGFNLNLKKNKKEKKEGKRKKRAHDLLFVLFSSSSFVWIFPLGRRVTCKSMKGSIPAKNHSIVKYAPSDSPPPPNTDYIWRYTGALDLIFLQLLTYGVCFYRDTMGIDRGNANIVIRISCTRIHGSATCGGTAENVLIRAPRALALSPSNGRWRSTWDYTLERNLTSVLSVIKPSPTCLTCRNTRRRTRMWQ